MEAEIGQGPHGSGCPARRYDGTMTTASLDRRLATIEAIQEVRPIPDADAIACARIRGWDVVVKRGEFAPGDLCVYVEVDTLVSVDDPRFAFLSARGTRSDAEGNTGHVLKTARLRGQYSQGLALPLAEFPELARCEPGQDVTMLLPVRRWDPPMPAQLAGQVNGRRPSWIPATDEERIQNIERILQVHGVAWVATEKLDGTSTTAYVDPRAGDPGDPDPARWPGVRGVCSRNYDLAHDPGNTMWRLVTEMRLHELMSETWPGLPVAVQGETVGEGIQGNPLRLKGQRLAVFTIRVGQVELPRCQWPDWAHEIGVPVYPGLAFPRTVDEAVDQVDGLVSLLSPGAPAEGVVWRAEDTARVRLDADERASFKVISRKYLLKHDR